MHATPRPLKFLTMLSILLAATLLSQFSPLHSQHGKAEDFVLYSIDGKRTVFYEMLQSLPGDGMRLVNFTSLYCKPCRREIPQLVRIAAGAPARAKLVIVYAEGAAGAAARDRAGHTRQNLRRLFRQRAEALRGNDGPGDLHRGEGPHRGGTLRQLHRRAHTEHRTDRIREIKPRAGCVAIII